ASVGKIGRWHMAQIRLESGIARLECSTVIVPSTGAASRCSPAMKTKWVRRPDGRVSLPSPDAGRAVLWASAKRASRKRRVDGRDRPPGRADDLSRGIDGADLGGVGAASVVCYARLPATGALAGAPGSATHARRVRQLDLELTAIELVAIETLDGLGGLLGRRHLNEAEPARAAGVPIHDDGGGLDGADLGNE